MVLFNNIYDEIMWWLTTTVYGGAEWFWYIHTTRYFLSKWRSDNTRLTLDSSHTLLETLNEGVLLYYKVTFTPSNYLPIQFSITHLHVYMSARTIYLIIS